jgi:hypothetical protein
MLHEEDPIKYYPYALAERTGQQALVLLLQVNCWCWCWYVTAAGGASVGAPACLWAYRIRWLFHTRGPSSVPGVWGLKTAMLAVVTQLGVAFSSTCGPAAIVSSNNRQQAVAQHNSVVWLAVADSA